MPPSSLFKLSIALSSLISVLSSFLFPWVSEMENMLTRSWVIYIDECRVYTVYGEGGSLGLGKLIYRAGYMSTAQEKKNKLSQQLISLGRTSRPEKQIFNGTRLYLNERFR